MKNKRGLSDVITVVLIILLAIVAVGIIWLVISRTLKSTEGSIDASQFTVKMEIVDNYVKVEGGKVSVNIRRGPGEGDVKGVRVVVEGDTGTTVVKEVNQDIAAFETIVVVVDYQQQFTTAKKIYVYPIIINEGKEVTANVADEYTIRGDEEGGIQGYCGDTTCDSGEECSTDCLTELYCQDGVDNDGDDQTDCLDSDCSATSSCAEVRVFVTSARYSGNLGGLTGADQKCQTLGDTIETDKVWKAWLSDGTTSAASRITHSQNAYVLVDGTIIANNWEELTDGSIDAAIKINEQGNDIGTTGIKVYTQTTTVGDISPNGGKCNDGTSDWTSNSNTVSARTGEATSIDGAWTDKANTSCDNNARLYCFEYFG